MTEIRFYHLQSKKLDQALPEILSKAIANDERVIVKTINKKETERLNELLWTYRPNSFLPHGIEKNAHAEDQPIWLTDKDENPNKAAILILTGGATSEHINDFKLCCEMLDGNDQEAVVQARKRWNLYKEQDFDMTYWQQTSQGGWEKKS